MKHWSIELAELARQAGPVFRQGYVDPLIDAAPTAGLRPVRRAPDSAAPLARTADPPSLPRAAAPAIPPRAAGLLSRAAGSGTATETAIAPAGAVGGPVDIAGLDSAQAIDRINGLVKACTACQLCKTRSKVVPGTGSIHPVAMVIGEAPGADEDRVGLPFVGAAGQFLDKWLEAIGLSRYSNIYITNTLKCRPPQNRDPEPAEGLACEAYLRAQIECLKPRAILALGRFASSWLMGGPVVMGEVHGHTFEFQGIPWVPTYHPSAVLRNAELKRPVWEDLKAFKALYQK